MSKEQNKKKALEALIDSNSLTEAAEKAGISRKTLYNYLHTERDFALAYQEMLEQQILESIDAVSVDREKAHSVIREILGDKEQPAAIRLKAAEMVLKSAAGHEESVSAIASKNVDRTSTPWVSLFE